MAVRYTSSFDKTIRFSDTCALLTLKSTVVTVYTVPGNSDQKFVLTFGTSSNSNIFCGYNVTPAIPADNTVTQDTGVEFVTPDEQRYAIGGDVLSFITPDATAYLGISVRSIPN